MRRFGVFGRNFFCGAMGPLFRLFFCILCNLYSSDGFSGFCSGRCLWVRSFRTFGILNSADSQCCSIQYFFSAQFLLSSHLFRSPFFPLCGGLYVEFVFDGSYLCFWLYWVVFVSSIYFIGGGEIAFFLCVF